MFAQMIASNSGKDHVVKESADDLVENSCVSLSIDSNVNNNCSQQQETPKDPALKKHRKLHWGYILSLKYCYSNLDISSSFGSLILFSLGFATTVGLTQRKDGRGNPICD